MPRKKTAVLGQQVYQLPGYGPHAKVTIDYDVTNPPPFFQPGAGVVIVGEHACAPQQGLQIDPGFDVAHAAHHQQPRRAEIPRGGNFEVAEDDPAYLAFKAKLGRGPEPAPPDLSPSVITSQDLLASTPGFEGVDLRALIAPTGTEGG